MAKKYVEPGLYTYATTPTWGVAQDGNGEAKGAATPATTSIVFSGVPSSGTISLAGASVSTSGVIGAASADAAANALAANINATTANVTTTGWRSGAVQLRNAVFARGPSGGAPSGTCQVMTRQGSAAFNGQNAFVFTLNNVSTSSPTTFSGGANGAWGWLWTLAESSIWPSGIARGGYGAIANTLPFAGSIAAGDVVHVRANNVTIDGGAGDYSTAFDTGATLGSATAPVRYVVGDPSEWTSDSATSTLRFRHPTGGARTWSIFSSGANTHFLFDGGVTAAGEPRTWFENYSTSTTGAIVVFTRQNSDVVRGCRFYASSNGRVDIVHNATKSQGHAAVYEFCSFEHPQNAAFLLSYSSGRYATLSFVHCTFSNSGASVPNSNGLFGIATNDWLALLLDSCRFTNFVSGSSLFTTPNQALFHTIARNCDFGNVTKWSVLYTLSFTGSSVDSDKFCSVVSQFGSRDFMLDTPRGAVEHVGARTYPTRNAVLDDGTTKWSLRVQPTTQAANMRFGNYFALPRIGKRNTLGENFLSVTLNMAIEQNLSWTKADVSMGVVYMDKDGVPRYQNTWDADGSALDAGTGTWSSESGGQVTFDDGGGTQYFNKKSLTVTTSYKVKPDTEVGVFVRIHSSVANTSRYLFVDPDIDLAVA